MSHPENEKLVSIAYESGYERGYNEGVGSVSSIVYYIKHVVDNFIEKEVGEKDK